MQSWIAAWIGGLVLALKHPGLVALRWLLNLGTAWIIVTPVAALVASDLAGTNYDPFVEGIDPSFLWEFYNRNREALDQLRRERGFWFLLFMAANLAVSGGILETLQRDRIMGPQRFIEACFKRLPFLAVAFVVNLGMIWLAFLIATAIAGRVVPFLPVGWHLIGWLLFFAFGLLLMSWVLRFYDNWRLLMTQPDQAAKPVLHFLKAFGFTVKYHIGTFAIFVFFWVIQLVVIWMHSGFAATSQTTGWMALSMAQLFIIARVYVSLAHVSSMYCFLRDKDGLTAATASSKTTAPEEPEEEAAPFAEYDDAYDYTQDEADAQPEPIENPKEPEPKADPVEKIDWSAGADPVDTSNADSDEDTNPKQDS